MNNEAQKYQAFYTKSTPIVDYMLQNLSLKKDDYIFEPCGGDGVFVDAILSQNESAKIDVYELNPHAVRILKDKFSHFSNIDIKESDTLLDAELSFKISFGGGYDKIIANPPYGAWQDYEKRKTLKKLYPDLYAKESYGLFLFKCIELLNEGGILSFIIPDTYLNLHMHKMLRRIILTKTEIQEIALFPSSFFPGVNFGYADLSIITLKKQSNKTKCLKNTFMIKKGFQDVYELPLKRNENLKNYSFSQNEIYKNPDYAFLIANDAILNLINNSELTVGDIADCVTGFYSGDDKKFLKVRDKSLKNGKRYDKIDFEKINENYIEQKNLLEGISEEKHFVPIVKGGNIRYLKPEDWFMDWSTEAVKHYKSNSKSRFQNPTYYFKYGIGVPMISSSSITASLIENKLFDQSIVGIFPKDEGLTYYLLAFFNSTVCNKLIRTINPSANNPANYIKKIPFILPSKDDVTVITQKVKLIIKHIKETGKSDTTLEEELNEYFEKEYNFKSETKRNKNGLPITKKLARVAETSSIEHLGKIKVSASIKV